MTDRTCTADGCEAPHQARGFCKLHYRRWRYSLAPDAPERKDFPSPAECIAEGCAVAPKARGLCDKHLSRLVRHGDVSANPFVPRGTCVMPGCDLPHQARGLCDRHYGRWLRHGDPNRVDRPGPIPNDGYLSAHRKIYKARGPAADQGCAHCDKPAGHWAYDHADADERCESGRSYSLDPSHYLPLCVKCHKVFDADWHKRNPVTIT